MKSLLLITLLILCGQSFSGGLQAFAPGSTSSNVAPGEMNVSYHVYVPTTHQATEPAPLLILFSAGGKGRAILEKVKPSAEKAGWIVAGVDKLRNGMNDEDLARQMEDEVLTEIFSRVPHNANRMYLGGFSGGAMRAYGITARRSEPYAGVISYGGWLGGNDYQDLSFCEGMAVAIVNGDHDKGANKWDEIDTATLEKRNCRVKRFSHGGGHKIAPSEVSDKVFQWLEKDWVEANSPAANILTPDTVVQPGSTYYMYFPTLGKTWRDKPTRAGVYFPTDYDPAKNYPLFVWFGGGAGSDTPKKPGALTEGKGFVCVALPYRSEENGQLGGWQTPWSYYETMFQALEKRVPNIDPKKRVAGGHSSGGAAVMYQLGNSDGAFQNYFHAFMPAGAGWPMGGLESIKGRPMLAVIGENDKRKANFDKLDEAARAAGVDITYLVMDGVGHKFSTEFHPQVRGWLKENVE